ncbi:hypothetical protein [Methanocorpusculum vombati]|uniref:Uncharacterized protein n=1 Tax=Methanocorpusculum vombati TaxID=3002864 RepID=A0ABT4IMN7_9EURY|nr:hypothetical protein [Methanocorpusculum vombati]MCZ9319932.1 hypothetical protein [Methanocorpusculum sp.]MCZ0862338.1 hypothetical protein [Methanocorpusculum vombati]MDE2519957.1 hypothetical protein [Methanocorpusculum sp.]MDE2546524.1 hypothetical protein [Methanocorpusculum sp.]MDE2547224.1 hypothetical protein [Methanocorpusculum sp.]
MLIILLKLLLFSLTIIVFCFLSWRILTGRDKPHEAKTPLPDWWLGSRVVISSGVCGFSSLFWFLLVYPNELLPLTPFLVFPAYIMTFITVKFGIDLIVEYWRNHEI